jgi:hypothetical protein
VIALSRDLARRFLSVLRRSVWDASGSKNIPPVLFQAGPQGLTLSSQFQEIALSVTEPGHYWEECCALAGEAFRDFAGKGIHAIHLDVSQPGWVEVWDGEDKRCPALDPESLSPFPACPDWLQAQEPHFVAALGDAMETAWECEGPRYALHYVQMRGSGVLIGTDSRQLLWQEDFDFPWSEDILVPKTKAFACEELRREAAAVGKTENHVFFRIGPWTLALAIGEGRYPEVERVLPSGSGYDTQWRLSDTEASFLLRQLPRLPHYEEGQGPITIDLFGAVCIRSREQEGVGRQLVLPQAEVTGPALRWVTDRRYLKRALELGFRAIAFSSQPGLAGSAWCREERRQFLWMGLGGTPLEPQESDEQLVL